MYIYIYIYVCVCIYLKTFKNISTFEKEPIIKHRWNQNLEDLIKSKEILAGKVERIYINKSPLYCRLCFARRDNICSQQVLKTNTFTSCRTGEKFKTFHQLNCKSLLLIYFIQCWICQLQYLGKSETSFNIRLQNHWKDSKNKNPILACKPVQNLNHNSQRDEKFILIEQIVKTFTSIEELQLMATSKETGKLLDSKTENTLRRWFELRT